uniref:Kinesin-like protein KIF26A/B helical domain-containing protein n=1 Tax=Branchiostoma floridae TaxID=7739 RepID=C3YGS8_BRAFL|eukprot:XP_002604388.1 hypothetical protein BRAFLDRAFT_79309 [Branchiostoma floridae]
MPAVSAAQVDRFYRCSDPVSSGRGLNAMPGRLDGNFVGESDKQIWANIVSQSRQTEPVVCCPPCQALSAAECEPTTGEGLLANHSPPGRPSGGCCDGPRAGEMTAFPLTCGLRKYGKPAVDSQYQRRLKWGKQVQDSDMSASLAEKLQIPEGLQKGWSSDHCETCATHLDQLKQDAIAMVQSLDEAQSNPGSAPLGNLSSIVGSRNIAALQRGGHLPTLNPSSHHRAPGRHAQGKPQYPPHSMLPVRSSPSAVAAHAQQLLEDNWSVSKLGFQHPHLTQTQASMGSSRSSVSDIPTRSVAERSVASARIYPTPSSTAGSTGGTSAAASFFARCENSWVSTVFILAVRCENSWFSTVFILAVRCENSWVSTVVVRCENSWVSTVVVRCENFWVSTVFILAVRCENSWVSTVVVRWGWPVSGVTGTVFPRRGAVCVCGHGAAGLPVKTMSCRATFPPLAPRTSKRHHAGRSR